MSLLADSPPHLLDRALDFARRQPGGVLAAVDLYQRGPACLRDPVRARQALDALAEQGRLVRLPAGTPVNGRRRREAWRLCQPQTLATRNATLADRSQTPSWGESDQNAPTWSAADWQEFYDERLAVSMIDGEMPEPEARRIARECCLVHWLRLHQPATPPTGTCPGARRADAVQALAELGIPPSR